MTKRLGIFMIALIFLSGEIQAQKDSVFLFAGQVFIGNIKGARLGELTIDDNSVRIIEMKMYRIKKISAVQRFKIETDSRIIYYGTLKEGKQPGWVNIILDDSSVVSLNILDISVITALEKGFWTRLNGTVTAGFSYAKSKDLGQFNVNSNMYYTGEVVDYQLTLSAIASIDSGAFSRDRENANLFTGIRLNPTWFAALGFDYERNLELSIARRFQELVGAGNKLLITRNLQLLAISGLTFNQELSTSGISRGLLLEIPLIIRFNFFKYRKPNLQISTAQSISYSLSQKDRVRYGGNLAFSWELIKDFYWTINPYANFDSQPPEGNSKSDFGIAVGLSYKF